MSLAPAPELSHPRHKRTEIVKDKQGNLLTREMEVRKRWKEHFEEVLNRPEPQQGTVLVGSTEVNEEIDTGYPTKSEIKEAILRTKNCKAGGVDKIVAEMLKADVGTSTTILEKIFVKVWDGEEVPEDWKRGLIARVPKKGNLMDCGNWRGITLMAVIAKIMGRIIIKRIKDGTDAKLRNEQAGFRTGRGTIEQIFILKNIIEQSIEWNNNL